MALKSLTSKAVVTVGSWGFPIRIKVHHFDPDADAVVVTNISSATVLQVKLLAPDGMQETKPALFLTDGSDGIMQYVVEEDIIHTDGIWQVQGYLELAGPWRGHTQVGGFVVEPLLF